MFLAFQIRGNSFFMPANKRAEVIKAIMDHLKVNLQSRNIDSCLNDSTIKKKINKVVSEAEAWSNDPKKNLMGNLTKIKERREAHDVEFDITGQSPISIASKIRYDYEPVDNEPVEPVDEEVRIFLIIM